MSSTVFIRKESFNRDLNRGCFVCMFSLRFSGNKFFEASCHAFPEYHNMSTKCNH